MESILHHYAAGLLLHPINHGYVLALQWNCSLSVVCKRLMWLIRTSSSESFKHCKMPPNEGTPLLQTVIITAPRERYSHSYIRRFCTAALLFTLIVVVVLFLVPGRWLPGNPSESEWVPALLPWRSLQPHPSWPESRGLRYEDLQKVLLETPKEEKAREWSKYYTSGAHLAGKNLSQALWTRERWQEFGVESQIVDYDVYLNYPLTHRLALLDEDISEEVPRSGKNGVGKVYKVKYECSLEEDVLEEDPTTGASIRVPTFHGYGANGNVTSQYVFANFGTYQDFEDLINADVKLEGNIAVVKYGMIFRGLKIKRAQQLGMVGVIIYTDPEEDGEINEQNGFDPYPDGPARQPSSVQRGSVQIISDG